MKIKNKFAVNDDRGIDIPVFEFEHLLPLSKKFVFSNFIHITLFTYSETEIFYSTEFINLIIDKLISGVKANILLTSEYESYGSNVGNYVSPFRLADDLAIRMLKIDKQVDLNIPY
jgi:hypothetical protein